MRENRKVQKGFRQKTLTLVASALVGSFLGFGASADSSVEAQKLLSAQRDYVKYCANCHGEEGRGDGPYTQMYKVYPIDLRLLAMNNDGKFPAEYVRKLIDGRDDIRKHGQRTMPGWFDELWSSPEGKGSKQANERVNALTDYLSRIQITKAD
ncbi:MAG: hypothetical protein DRQ54_03930 [Gammaproteobacteria bacterium]|nr:MAG: hypothetical protein DRQ54_03930 [Gammaproteobacteria bacterium]